MRNKRKIGVYLIAISILGMLLMPMALADSSNVTVTWVIPADTSVTITYPTGTGKIKFEPASKTFVEEQATSQGAGTAGMNIENIGNTALQINFTFSDTWYDAGLEFFNCSVNTNDNATKKVYWTNSNETANHTVVASLAVSADEDFWFWSTGTDCLESAEGDDTETLVVWYTNA